jgi:hypothetical protein
MKVLIITTREEALHHGAKVADGTHRSLPDVRFWWPVMGRDCLVGLQFDLIIRDASLWLPRPMVGWLRSNCCRRKEALFVEANEIGGSVLLERT